MAEEEIQEKAEASAEEKINQLRSEIEDLTGKWKRTAADYANLERRAAQEKETITKYANSFLLLRFLPVLDSLEKAVAAQPENAGLVAIVRQFNNILAMENIQEIAALDQTFDPRWHDCLEVVKGEAEDKVVEILRKGYRMGERVLRPAQVRVSKRFPQGAEEETPPSG